MAVNIKLNEANIDAAVNNMRNKATTFYEAVSKFAKSVVNVDEGEWKGDTRDAYAEAVSKFSNLQAKIAEVVSQGTTAANEAKTTLLNADTQNASDTNTTTTNTMASNTKSEGMFNAAQG